MLFWVQMRTLMVVLAFAMSAGTVHAQTSDSTSLTSGSPPLPTGIWDASGAANTLSTTMISQNATIASETDAVNNAYSTASAAAGSAGSASAISVGVEEGYDITYAGNGEAIVSGLCESTYHAYIDGAYYVYDNGVNIPVPTYAYPTTPGTNTCPAATPYFYPVYGAIQQNNSGDGG